MRNRYRNLLIDLINYHNGFVDAGEFGSELMILANHQAIVKLLFQAVVLGILSEQEAGTLSARIKTQYGI